MSTSPRARARPSIDAPSTGSTMPGKSVTMSIRIPYLQVEQALGRADHHPARLEVDLAHDLRDRRALSPHGGNPVLLAPIARRVPQQALPQAREPFRMVRHRRHADLAGEPVGPRDRADHDEALAHSAFTFARSFRTVFEGWAPLAIHAWTFARSIFTVGGCVSGL